MFQKQQNSLQSLITQQQKLRADIERQYTNFEKRLTTVEEKLKNTDQSTSSGSSIDRTKIKVTRDLSVSKLYFL